MNTAIHQPNGSTSDLSIEYSTKTHTENFLSVTKIQASHVYTSKPIELNPCRGYLVYRSYSKTRSSTFNEALNSDTIPYRKCSENVLVAVNNKPKQPVRNPLNKFKQEQAVCATDCNPEQGPL
ncbi:hypothetical protein BDB01DRAFT_835897 [Pilobolus umbonatus]|nr:hypothetical protein BDB01DRAFT_835897 [Pilobolus umbonatus]